jgi:hypothetical protein
MILLVFIGGVLFLMPRSAFRIGLATLTLVAIATSYFLKDLRLEQRQAEQIRKRAETIMISASYDKGRCTAEFPILIEIRNGYWQTIYGLKFELGGYQADNGSPVYLGRSYRTKHVIEPGQTYAACWQQPELIDSAQAAGPDSLAWRATYASASLRDPPDQIPGRPAGRWARGARGGRR